MKSQLQTNHTWNNTAKTIKVRNKTSWSFGFSCKYLWFYNFIRHTAPPILQLDLRPLTSGRARVRQREPQREDDRREQHVCEPFPPSGWPGHVHSLLWRTHVIVGVPHLQTHDRLRRERLTRAHRRHAPLDIWNRKFASANVYGGGVGGAGGGTGGGACCGGGAVTA